MASWDLQLSNDPTVERLRADMAFRTYKSESTAGVFSRNLVGAPYVSNRFANDKRATETFMGFSSRHDND